MEIKTEFITINEVLQKPPAGAYICKIIDVQVNDRAFSVLFDIAKGRFENYFTKAASYLCPDIEYDSEIGWSGEYNDKKYELLHRVANASGIDFDINSMEKLLGMNIGVIFDEILLQEDDGSFRPSYDIQEILSVYDLFTRGFINSDTLISQLDTHENEEYNQPLVALKNARENIIDVIQHLKELSQSDYLKMVPMLNDAKESLNMIQRYFIWQSRKI